MLIKREVVVQEGMWISFWRRKLKGKGKDSKWGKILKCCSQMAKRRKGKQIKRLRQVAKCMCTLCVCICVGLKKYVKDRA
jgi:hypothetical protein